MMSPGGSGWPASDLCYAFQDTRQVCLNLKWKWVEERKVKEDDDVVSPAEWEPSLEEDI